jgi:hypothetical protein
MNASRNRPAGSLRSVTFTAGRVIRDVRKPEPMRTDEGFRAAYRALERRMKALAEAEGDVFLPNPEPQGPVEYVLICMEPSLGRWARNADEARSRVEAGFRNFIFSIEDCILHFCVRQYLCGAEQRYHITDLSKGAMLVEHASIARAERYDRWYALLEEELELVSSTGTGFVAVGKPVSEHLMRRGFSRPFTRIIHYSGQAASARKAGTVGREGSFESFKASVSLDDLIANAKDVLLGTGVPDEIRDETLARLTKSQLSESRRQLIFNYKTAFELLRREGRSRNMKGLSNTLKPTTASGRGLA